MTGSYNQCVFIAFNILSSRNLLWKFKMMYCNIYNSILLYNCLYTVYNTKLFREWSKFNQLNRFCQLGNVMNANKLYVHECFWGIPMLTGNIDVCYPDVDADLCIRSMFCACFYEYKCFTMHFMKWLIVILLIKKI